MAEQSDRLGCQRMTNGDDPKRIASMTRETVANVGDTHNGYVTIKAESRATTATWNYQAVIADALYETDFTLPVIVDAGK